MDGRMEQGPKGEGEVKRREGDAQCGWKFLGLTAGRNTRNTRLRKGSSARGRKESKRLVVATDNI